MGTGIDRINLIGRNWIARPDELIKVKVMKRNYLEQVLSYSGDEHINFTERNVEILGRTDAQVLFLDKEFETQVFRKMSIMDYIIILINSGIRREDANTKTYTEIPQIFVA